jgi:hypothetical protein
MRSSRAPTTLGVVVRPLRLTARLRLRRSVVETWTCVALVTAAFAVAASVPRLAHGQGRTRDLPSVFFVAKSENKNQVHYGIHLDEACAPVGRAPVFAYWRMLEHGPFATEPLLAHEVPAYGLGDQRVLARGATGGQVAVTLHALSARTIVIATRPEGDACRAEATTTIGGGPAALTSVFAQLAWPFGVSYLVIFGRGIADGREVRERVVP